MPGGRFRRHEAGFTLIEMLVVLTIIGIVSAIALTRLSSGPSFIRRGTVRATLAQDAALARQTALASARPAAMTFGADLAGITFMPALGSATAGPLFYPDGSSNGGVFTLKGEAIARLDWMTGALRDPAA